MKETILPVLKLAFRFLAVVFLLVVLLPFSPRLLSAFYVNLGSLGLSRTWLTAPEALSEEHVTQIRSNLRSAIWWNPGNARAERLMGQVTDWSKFIDQTRGVIAQSFWQKANGNADLVDYPKFYEALVDLYSVASSGDPCNARFHFLKGKYLKKIGRWDEAVKEFRLALTDCSGGLLARADSGMAYYYLGLDYEKNGNMEKAVESYEKGLELNQRIIDAYYRLVHFYRKSGMRGKAEDLEARLASLEPEYTIKQKVGDDWMLLGYDLDEEELETGAEIEFSFYWIPSGKITVESADWYRAGERWIELREVRNLVPNAGFEWAVWLGSNQSPFGFRKGMYKAPRESYEVVIDQRNDRETKCARLSNSGTYQESSFNSLEIPVNTAAIYLQAILMRSEGGSGRLLNYWFGSVRRSPAYRYVFLDVTKESWTYFVEITKPFEGASSVELWLINSQLEGKVYFDNIVFFELKPPRFGSGQ